ncbi:VWFC domain [Trinorchestia longiramus]|nr:VWFC domain [Trinorchestia longiramus]
MLEEEKIGKLLSQASELLDRTSLRNHCSKKLHQRNVKQNREMFLFQGESSQHVRKQNLRQNSPSNIEGDTQERLFEGSSEDTFSSIMCSSSRRIIHNRKCCSTPLKKLTISDEISRASKKKDIINNQPVGLDKVKPKLLRSVVSISSQCLLMIAWAALLVCGEAARAHEASCFKCGLRPSQSQRSPADERLTMLRQEDRMKAENTINDFASTQGPPDLPLGVFGLELQTSQAPPPGDGRLGQLCGPRMSCGPGLECRYSVPGTLGLCREAQKLPCAVNGTVYDDGSTFRPDCRTQCTCTGGAYACVSLCPEEALPPSSACKNPALQASERSCCRQWTCDPDPDLLGAASPQCAVSVSRWSACSSLTCGLGLSQRWATDKVSCRPVLQTRLCQLRPCRVEADIVPRRQMRRSHHCKATIRAEKPQRLVAGPCVSQRRYRVKRCNTCPGACCSDFMDTSLEVPFLCPLHSVPPYLVIDSSLSPVDQASLFDSVTDSDTQESKLGDFTADGDVEYTNVTASNYEVVVKQVQWIVRCRCTPTCQTPQLLSTTFTTLDPEFSFGES